MFPFLTIIFLLVPVLEIYLLIQVGQVIGALWTALLVVLTAVIGVRLLKIQGISTLMRAQEKMQSGQLPAHEMLEGMGLVVAGAFLLTPGFFTDVVGFLLLFPPSRRALMRYLLARLVASGRFSMQGDVVDVSGARPATRGSHNTNIIDGVRYTRDDESNN